MPLIVPPPWRLGTPPAQHDAILRHCLEWVRDPEPGEAPSTVGVIMYNPAGEGEELLILGKPDRVVTLDGAAHRRVRSFLSSYASIRVANLSPYRSTKPREAQRWERIAWKQRATLSMHHTLAEERRSAIAWACEAPVVVCAWGAGALYGRMTIDRNLVYQLAAGRMWCWGETLAGDPLHPSPLGQVKNGAALARFKP